MDRPAVPGGRLHSLRRRSLMLATLLLAGLFAAPGATALLFLPNHTPSSTAGPWPWTRRFVLTLVGSALGAVVISAILVALGVTRGHVQVAAATLVAASLLW